MVDRDPVAGRSYPVVLGHTLGGDQRDADVRAERFVTLRYDFKPKSADRCSHGTMRVSDSDQVHLCLAPNATTDANDGASGGDGAAAVGFGSNTIAGETESGAVHFRGRQKVSKETECIIIFVPGAEAPGVAGGEGYFLLEREQVAVRGLRHVCEGSVQAHPPRAAVKAGHARDAEAEGSVAPAARAHDGTQPVHRRLKRVAGRSSSRLRSKAKRGRQQ